MKADEAAQPGTPLPSDGQAIGCDAVGSQPPFVPDYTLLCRIGIGAYGEVWLARGTLGTYRAVKIVSRRSFEHDLPFEREFKGIQRFEPISLTHESQVKILHVGSNEDAGYFYYVMELADDASAERGMRSAESATGSPASTRHSALLTPHSYVPRTLKHELKTRGRLPADECVQIGLALTKALTHLHDHGLIHRDVKPSNIIFVSGVPKLADIGLVTDVEATRSFVGTEGFIPPEGPGTVSADLYSLGKVLYEISMGRSRLDFPALPANWDDLPEDDQARLREFNEVLVKACESDAARRYGSARQMHADLELFQRGKSVRRQRMVSRRFAIAKRVIFGVMLVLLVITVPPLVKVLIRGRGENPEVKRLYDKGRWYRSQLTAEDSMKAVKHLNDALQIDPRFVPAYVELFELYLWTFPGVAGTRQEQLRKMSDIANKLLAINPKLAEGHAALSYCKYLERDWQGAEAEIQRAIQLNPNYPMGHSLYGYYLSLLGRTDEALREVRRGEELDSASSRVAVLVGWYPFMAARQFDQAIAQIQRVVDLDKNFLWAHAFLGRCYEAQSNYLAAIETFKTADLLSGEDPAETAEFYAALRQAYDTGGEQSYWRKNLECHQAYANLPDGRRPSRIIAGCYARLGEKEKALEDLETHFDEMTVWNALKFEPAFDSLHDEPRFKALLKRAGLAD